VGQQYSIIKNIFWWFYVHVQVGITILYYNWSKNHIGTKLRKQSKQQVWGLAEHQPFGLKLDI